MNKVVELEELSKIIKKQKKLGKKVVHSHGVFDLLHPGHIRHFQSAKKHGDILVVTVTKDEFVNKGPGRPVFNHRLRAESIASLECVDYVAVNKWPTAVETIKLLKPDFYIKGSDYSKKDDDLTGKIYNEENAVNSEGGKIVFTDDITFSSSTLLNLHFSVYPKEADKFLREFKKKYTSSEVIDILKSLKDQKVLIIGDTIIDEYHYCMGMGKPAKDDIISSKYLNEERFTGGALAIAKHVANFCGKVSIVSVLGKKNDYKDFIKKNLPANVKTRFFDRADVPTVVKRRFVNPSFLNKSFEINYVDDRKLPEKLTDKICKFLETEVPKYDVVIVADFGMVLLMIESFLCYVQNLSFYLLMLKQIVQIWDIIL